jgi:hypothetical protein
MRLAKALDERDKLDIQIKTRYILNRIKRRADALANLPHRARWFPQGDAATSATKRVAREPALLGKPTEGFLFHPLASVARSQVNSRPEI